jgi:hypothetical protein
MSKLECRKLFRHFVVGPLAAATLLLAAAPADAVKVAMPDKPDVFISVGLLMQPWVYLNYNVDKGNDPDLLAQFYVRRTRFILGGGITKWFSFFAETDMPNWGKTGDFRVTAGGNANQMFIQDAFASIDINPAFHLMFGLILPPFVHHSYQGATSLHTLDYHTGIVKYPGGSNIVWRSGGVMARGHVLSSKLEYRFAVTTGIGMNYVVTPASGTTPASPAVDTDGIPRLTGRVVYNLWDAEDGPFTGGTYLGKKKILSIGLAVDGQPGAFGKVYTPTKDAAGNITADNWTRYGYFGVGGDIFLDMPMGTNVVTGQLSVAHYRGEKNAGAGTAFFFDGGYMIGRLEPLIGFDYYKPAEGAEKKDATGAVLPNQSAFSFFGGVNYWWVGHNANLKLQVGYDKPSGKENGKGDLIAILQTQIMLY